MPRPDHAAITIELPKLKDARARLTELYWLAESLTGEEGAGARRLCRQLNDFVAHVECAVDQDILDVETRGALAL